MKKSRAQEIFDSFESSFRDKVVIPFELELVWLKKAIGRFSTEIEELEFDEDTMQFSKKLDQYAIDTLAAFMKQLYQEREASRINKLISVVTKDLSINAGGHSQVAVREELEYCRSQSELMAHRQKPPAYS